MTKRTIEQRWARVEEIVARCSRIHKDNKHVPFDDNTNAEWLQLNAEWDVELLSIHELQVRENRVRQMKAHLKRSKSDRANGVHERWLHV